MAFKISLKWRNFGKSSHTGYNDICLRPTVPSGIGGTNEFVASSKVICVPAFCHFSVYSSYVSLAQFSILFKSFGTKAFKNLNCLNKFYLPNSCYSLVYASNVRLNGYPDLRHRDIFSTDVFLTDTFSTNEELDIFSTSNKMGHIFDH